MSAFAYMTITLGPGIIEYAKLIGSWK